MSNFIRRTLDGKTSYMVFNHGDGQYYFSAKSVQNATPFSSQQAAELLNSLIKVNKYNGELRTQLPGEFEVIEID